MRIPNIKIIKKPVKKLIFSFLFLSLFLLPYVSKADFSITRNSYNNFNEVGGRFEFRGLAEEVSASPYLSIKFELLEEEDSYTSGRDFVYCHNFEVGALSEYVVFDTPVYSYPKVFDQFRYFLNSVEDCDSSGELSPENIESPNSDGIIFFNESVKNWGFAYFLGFITFFGVVAFMTYLIRKFL